jgi:phosphohistidine phosphatase
MGEWLASEGLAPDYAVCSPAVRARQTVEAVLERLDLPSSFLHYDARIYAASAEALLAVLADTPDSAQRVLLVGHNPGLDDLCYHLCGERVPHTGSGKLMTTAAVAQIALPDTWSALEPGAGRMIRIMRPKALRP